MTHCTGNPYAPTSERFFQGTNAFGLMRSESDCIYMYACIYIRVYTMYVCMYVCIRICMYVSYGRTCVHIVYIISVYMYMYVYVCVMIFVYAPEIENRTTLV